MSNWVSVLDNFDASEERAWLSGQRREGLLASRSTIFNVAGSSKVRLYAHSMDNVVAIETLRIAAANGNSKPVQTYVSAQSALSSRVWNQTTPTMPDFLNRIKGYVPDIYGHFWVSGESNTDARSWSTHSTALYASVGNMPSQVKYVNHYNARDYALDLWRTNTSFKPNITFDYDPTISSFTTDSGFTTLSCPTNRYRIFSYAAPSHGLATGAEPAAFAGIAGSIPIDIDIRFGFGEKHKGHSAQFRSSIQKRWLYWTEAFLNLQ